MHINEVRNWWIDLPEDKFQETFRMAKRTFIDLQTEIDFSEEVNEDKINETLLACVWLLGNTKPFEEVQQHFNIENMEAVIQAYLLKILKLGSTYIVWPSESESKLIENGFAAEYGFPGVVGVIGSLHIEVNVSDQANSELYYNHLMEKHTIVLQVVCDNHHLLRDVCVGCPGGKTIKDILEESPLYTRLIENDSSLTKNKQHLLGGTEHPPLDNLLTPYKFAPDQPGLTQRQSKFNLLHNSVMGTVEQTFHCLENRFPRLTSCDNLEPELASLIASCICVLHNFTRVRNDSCELYL